jgi:dipeptidyl-peptidase II
MKSLPIIWLFLVALWVVDVDCLRLHKKPSSNQKSTSIPPFKTFYMTQFLDHFNLRDDRTFQQRYLVNDDHFNPISGPVFFYTGNEGDIESFWDNTGFMFDIAPLFQALVVFVEHRYYGKTLPFGDDSFDLDKVSYLTVEQALADYAVFLTQFRKDYNLTENNPIIAFGGSYGGILAAYMRFKYPNLVNGSIAASAPIYLTAGLAPSTLFFSDVTNDFAKEPGCVPLVRKAFAAMDDSFKKGDYSTLNNAFKLCNPISDEAGYHHLLLWMRNAFTIMAMVDYPYPASFLGDLPAWPVHYSCQQLVNETNSGVDILTAFKNLAGILYNDTTSTCFDIYAQFIECADPTSCGLGNDAKAWDYQACTELNTVQETNGVTDMFPVISYTPELRQEYCKRVWNVTIREDWTAINYWGRDIKSASNIVFSNGLLDPWHNGGPLTDLTESLVAVVISEGAHHLDLRAADPADPQSVKNARYAEILEIMKWIDGPFDKKKNSA